MQHCGRGAQSKASEETSLAKTGQSAYRIVHGSTRGLVDVENFLLTLSRSRDAHALFDQENDIFVGRAPGRLDVMGGIADYSGSLVLQLPIQQAALAAVQSNHLQSVEIVSLGNSENGRGRSSFSMLLPRADRWNTALRANTSAIQDTSGQPTSPGRCSCSCMNAMPDAAECEFCWTRMSRKARE